MGSHPLLKVGVGGGEVEVVKGVVAVVERGSGEGGVGKEAAAEEKKEEQPEKARCRRGGPGLGLGRERRSRENSHFILFTSSSMGRFVQTVGQAPDLCWHPSPAPFY